MPVDRIIGGMENDSDPHYIRLQLPLKKKLLAMDDARQENLQAVLKETDAYINQGKVRKKLETLLANW